MSYDLEGGAASGGSAVFSLVPAGSMCSDAVVIGNFMAGTSATSNDMLIVTVNVTKTGNWTVSTASINGLSFKGSGDFNTTGDQVITLQAIGKPTTPGNFDFNLNIGGLTCKFMVTVGSPGGGGGTSDIYYKATIDGINYYQAVTEDNNFEAGAGSGGFDDVVLGGGITYANPPLPRGLTELSVSKGVMHNYLSATEAQLKAFFATGQYSFAPESFSDGDGVQVVWTDTNGEVWYTRDGRTEQSGSNFKIISVEGSPDLAGRYYVKVKMQFNCKLYNLNTGAMKQLTNGELVAYFGGI